jgi:hypothetical protein
VTNSVPYGSYPCSETNPHAPHSYIHETGNHFACDGAGSGNTALMIQDIRENLDIMATRIADVLHELSEVAKLLEPLREWLPLLKQNAPQLQTMMKVARFMPGKRAE